MAIDYDEYELLELFCCLPKFYDEEVLILSYQTEDPHGFQLGLYLSVYEEVAVVSLRHRQLASPIFDHALHDVQKVRGEQDRLKIVTEQGKQLVIHFKPNFALNLDEWLL